MKFKPQEKGKRKKLENQQKRRKCSMKYNLREKREKRMEKVEIKKYNKEMLYQI